jgi:hypothetical protein
MKLKLVKTEYSPEENLDPSLLVKEAQKAITLALGLFIALKFPMCFATINPEELRDFDHFIKVSEGLFPYRDFVWLYGPLTPLVYGVLFKIFPAKLIIARLITLGIWSWGAYYLAKTIARYFPDPKKVIFGCLLVTACFGYPSYSHNHILASSACFFGFYHALIAVEESKERNLFFSFLGILVCFFTRPILMGLGAMAAWGIFYGMNREKFLGLQKRKVFCLTSGMVLFTLAGFHFLYGIHFWEFSFVFLPDRF